MNNGRIWNQPGKGLLAGEVIEIKNKNNFKIRDFNIKIWKIENDKNTIWLNDEDLHVGERLKMIGHQINDNEFYANEIRRMQRKKIKHLQKFR